MCGSSNWVRYWGFLREREREREETLRIEKVGVVERRKL